MRVLARRLGGAISDKAKERIGALKQYPTIDTWRNPLTRHVAKRLSNDAWAKTVEKIDFEYRLTDMQIDSVNCVLYEAESTITRQPVILYIHGGGFVAGSPKTNAANVLPLCHLSGCDAIGIDYSLLPDAVFPTQINEVSRVYRALLEEKPGRKIVILSDSTGSAIALSALMQWRREGLMSPAGAVFLSPCVDGKGSSDTQITADHHDPLIRSMGGKFIRRLFSFYAPDNDLSDPAVSPIYGNFENLPPFMIHAGSREVMLGDAARLAEAARQAGVETHLRVFDGMFHRFHMHWDLEETRTAYSDIANFIRLL
ncbi:MAG: hypothetical protein DHS20C05_23540 [Hyphococcus sp.]|nr:MAG: hypothetical protein DHS20C05_23540 [Marinicaulis sp.]